jgi:hypothetical protein
MSTWLKALLGIGVGVATVVIVKKVVVDKKYATVKEADTESKSLLKRLKEAAKDKVADILIWFANHPKETQIISVVLSVVPVIIGIGSDLDLMLTNRRINKRLSNLETESACYYLAGIYAEQHHISDVTDRLSEVAG